MATINYKFADGHREDIKVTENFAMQYELMDREFRRVEDRERKRNKRYHVSLEAIVANGWDKSEDNAEDPLEIAIREEREETNIIALSDFLTERQREIMQMYYEEKYSKSKIARELKISESTVRESLSSAISKILVNFKFFSKKQRNTPEIAPIPVLISVGVTPISESRRCK